MVCSLGFKRDMRCDDIVAVLRQTLFLAFWWGHTLYVGSLDIETAFDCIDHGELATALASCGIHAELVSCLKRELTGLKANISIPGADSTNVLHWSTVGSKVVSKRQMNST